jgi:F-type H+-transporting ATPase subunit gamma
MQTLESLRRRIGSAQDLHSIVKTMKALAAVSIRQFEKAVESLSEFNRTTELGLHIVLSGQSSTGGMVEPHPESPVGAFVFGSDQGMCGQFNEQIAGFTAQSMPALKPNGRPERIVAVGLRAIPPLEDMGYEVQDGLIIPGAVSGIPRMVQTLLLLIDRWRNEHGIERVYLFYNRPISNAAYRPQMVRLLPIHLEHLHTLEIKEWPSRTLPTYTMDRSLLLASLIRQHLFVLLCRGLAESQASENAARLAAMHAAERNIEDRLVELNAHYHNQRQNSITSELLDIVSGFEVLTGIS